MWFLLLYWLFHAVSCSISPYWFFLYMLSSKKMNTIQFFIHFQYYFLCFMSPAVLWRRQRGDCGAQDVSFHWQPMVWTGQICLVRVRKCTCTDTHIYAPFHFLSSSHFIKSPHLPLSYVLECASCGVIYRSRQYWMGNPDPESGVVRSEVKHVWEGVSTPLFFSFSVLNSDIIVWASEGLMILYH